MYKQSKIFIAISLAGRGRVVHGPMAPQSTSILCLNISFHVNILVLLCLVPPPIKISGYANVYSKCTSLVYVAIVDQNRDGQT